MVSLGIGRLVGIEAGHAGVQNKRSDADSFAPELVEELAGQRSSGGRHLGASRLVRKNRLVIFERPRLRHVRVTNGRAVTLCVSERALRQPELGDPKAHSSGIGWWTPWIVGGDQTRGRSRGKAQDFVGLGIQQRTRRGWRAVAHLDDPGFSPPKQSGRQVQHDVADAAVAGLARRLERGVDRFAGVDDKDIATFQKVRQVRKAGVGDVVGGDA